MMRQGSQLLGIYIKNTFFLSLFGGYGGPAGKVFVSENQLKILYFLAPQFVPNSEAGFADVQQIGKGTRGRGDWSIA